MPDTSVLAGLRERVQRREGRDVRVRNALPFGVPEIDGRLLGGGLALGALHEVAGGGNGAVDGAVAVLFTAGDAARTKGKILRCVTRHDLLAPAFAKAGLAPVRVIFVEAGDEETLLACFEDGLRHGGLGAVVAEVAKLSLIRRAILALTHMWNGPVGKVVAASFAVGRCSHMSGLLARCWTVGHDEIPDADRLIKFSRSIGLPPEKWSSLK